MVAHIQTGRSHFTASKLDLVGQPFLETLVIEYGPLQVLGRFFAAATAELHSKGLHLRLSTLKNVHTIHTEHIASWPSYPPMLDPALTCVPEDRSYSLVCHSDDGSIAAVMAGRIYDGNRTLASIVQHQNFICEPIADTKTAHRFYVEGDDLEAICTPFSYIGALWVNPTHRGKDLARLLPALTRAYALAKWDIRYDIGLANDDMMKVGMAAVYGYTNTKCAFRASGLGEAHDVTGRLLWIDREEIENKLRHLLAHRFSKVERRSVDRSANQQV
jgi:GNAT superfamily N-acetyltransferase